MRHPGRLAVAALALASVTAGCGDDDGAAPSSSTASTAVERTTTSTTSTTSTITIPPTPRVYGAPVDLGVLPGGSNSFAGDINDDGIVVGASFVGEFEQYAVWWPDPTEGPVRLDEDLPVTDVQRRAFRINDRGRVLVHAGSRAFVVDPRADTAVEILVPFGESFEAQDLNDEGQVVGTAVIGWPPPDPNVSGPEPITHAFFWEPSTGEAIDLGTLPGAESSAAVAINDQGQVLGGSGTHIFVWDAETRRMRAVADNGTALDVNNSGSVVGGATDVDPAPGTQTHAALWDLETGEILDLGRLPGSAYDFTVASNINDAGQIVGMAIDAVWVWDPTTRAMTELESLGHDEVRQSAAAINERGQIVGVSDNHAVLWNPASGG